MDSSVCRQMMFRVNYLRGYGPDKLPAATLPPAPHTGLLYFPLGHWLTRRMSGSRVWTGPQLCHYSRCI